MKQFKLIGAILVSASFLFTSHGAASAMVLCVGSDGHVKMEVAIDGACAPDSDPHAGRAADDEAVCSFDHDADHCGPCLDIPVELGHSDPCHPVVLVEKPELKVPATSGIAGVFRTIAPSVHRFHPSPPPLGVTRAAITSLRSVSLLI